MTSGGSRRMASGDAPQGPSRSNQAADRQDGRHRLGTAKRGRERRAPPSPAATTSSSGKLLLGLKTIATSRWLRLVMATRPSSLVRGRAPALARWIPIWYDFQPVPAVPGSELTRVTRAPTGNPLRAKRVGGLGASPDLFDSGAGRFSRPGAGGDGARGCFVVSLAVH